MLERSSEIARRPEAGWLNGGTSAPLSVLADSDCDVSTRLTLFAADEEIAGPASGASNLFQVLFGVTRICTDLSDGRRAISAFHFPGEIFGFELGGNRGFHAEAVDAVGLRILAPPRGDQQKELLRLALAGLTLAQEHLLVVGRHTACERIACFLLDVARRQHHPKIIDLPMPRTDIADYLGLTPETVCRVFKLLHERGLIDFTSPRRVIINSAGALNRLIA